MDTIDITYICDPGHGWFKVTLTDLNGFEPSEFSYYDSSYAYLEEDCDMQGWLDYRGLQIDKDTEVVDQIFAKDEAFVRFLDRFPR